MPPGPSLLPDFPPRQPGESAYSYRNRRSIALTGQSLYQRRVAAGRARGLTTSEARGHAPTPAGTTEYQRRRQRTLQQYGLTPSQLRYLQIDRELNAAGFTPASTGISQTNLRRLWPRLRWINANTSPGGMLSPDVIHEAADMERDGFLPRGFIYERINNRYDAMYEFKMMNSNNTGRYFWFNEYRADYDGFTTAAWWYYH